MGLNLDQLSFEELILKLKQSKPLRNSVIESLKNYDAAKNNDSDINHLTTLINSVGDLSLLVRTLNPNNKDIQLKILQIALNKPEFKQTKVSMGDQAVLRRDFPQCHQEIADHIKMLDLVTSNPILIKGFDFSNEQKPRTSVQESPINEPPVFNTTPNH